MKIYNRNLIIVVVSFVMTLFHSCAPTTIYSDYSKTTDFKNYKSFAWLPKNHNPQQDSSLDNQIVESNVKNLASGELKSRGYQVNTNEPDVLLDFHINVADKVDQVTTPVYGYPYNYNNYNTYYNTYNPSTPYYNNIYSYNNSYYSNSYFNTPTTVVGYNTENVPYEEGTLTIIMIDRKTNQLIWKGWSVGTVTDEETFEYELPSDIHRLFKEFPVPVPKNKK